MENQLNTPMGLTVPPDLGDKLAAALCSPQFSGCFEPALVGDASSREALLGLAGEFSLAPISGFKVGALAIGKSGNGYLGANMEFTGVPLHATLHAEQSAVINAWMHGEAAIHSLRVSKLPCGHCRQFLLELHGAAELTIIVEDAAAKLAELMPAPFEQIRPKGRGLLESPRQKLVSTQAGASDNAQRAINAASRSYTPYSQSPEGFIIETINGQHFAGRMAESLAFNPSVPPVVTALNQMNLSAQRKVSISRCTHARLATALTQSFAFSEALMRGICNVPVENVLMESVS
ncbi:MAG: cytidine deaminase [Opitutales bacterium]